MADFIDFFTKKRKHFLATKMFRLVYIPKKSDLSNCISIRDALPVSFLLAHLRSVCLGINHLVRAQNVLKN